MRYLSREVNRTEVPVRIPRENPHPSSLPPRRKWEMCVISILTGLIRPGEVEEGKHGSLVGLKVGKVCGTLRHRLWACKIGGKAVVGKTMANEGVETIEKGFKRLTQQGLGD
jgi:hypothetical protein